MEIEEEQKNKIEADDRDGGRTAGELADRRPGDGGRMGDDEDSRMWPADGQQMAGLGTDGGRRADGRRRADSGRTDGGQQEDGRRTAVERMADGWMEDGGRTD